MTKGMFLSNKIGARQLTLSLATTDSCTGLLLLGALGASCKYESCAKGMVRTVEPPICSAGSDSGPDPNERQCMSMPPGESKCKALDKPLHHE